MEKVIYREKIQRESEMKYKVKDGDNVPEEGAVVVVEEGGVVTAWNMLMREESGAGGAVLIEGDVDVDAVVDDVEVDGVEGSGLGTADLLGGTSSSSEGGGGRVAA